MEKKLFLSIIVPVYNAEKYVGQCLDSLLEQDVGKDEYEIICINDGSKDGSLSILQEYAKNNSNIVVVNKENGGVSKARNLGLDMAKGEYVWFIDSDDWIVRNCLGIIKEAAQNSSPSIVQLDFDYIKAEWRINKMRDAKLDKDKITMEIVGAAAPMRYDAAWSLVVKREFFNNGGYTFREDIHYGEDLFFARDLFDCARLEDEAGVKAHNIVLCRGEIFYFYRMNDESAVRSAWLKNREKYANSLLKLAKINKERMEDERKPDWYRKQYKELFNRRMDDYLMNWLPGLRINVSEKLKELKAAGVYPIKTEEKINSSKEIKEKIMVVYKKLAKTCPLVYRVYYKQMSKKYL